MRNPTYEQALTRQGIQWHYVEKLKLDVVDSKTGLRNQARLEAPLDEELAVTYTTAIKNGDEFPPLVVYTKANGRVVPIDGNHRIAAYDRAGVRFTDAYVVDTSDELVINRLTWTFNNLVNGKRLSHAESLAHAVTFVRKYNQSIRVAAKEWGLTEPAVQRATKAAELRDVLNKHNVKLNPNVMSDGRLHLLSPLATAGEDLLVRAARIVSDNGLNDPDTRSLVKAVQAARTTEAKAQTVEDWAQSELASVSRARTKGGEVRAKPLPGAKLLSLLRQLQRLLEDNKPGILRTGDAFKNSREDAEFVVLALAQLYGLGAVAARKEVS